MGWNPISKLGVYGYGRVEQITVYTNPGRGSRRWVVYSVRHWPTANLIGEGTVVDHTTRTLWFSVDRLSPVTPDLLAQWCTNHALSQGLRQAPKDIPDFQARTDYMRYMDAWVGTDALAGFEITDVDHVVQYAFSPEHLLELRSATLSYQIALKEATSRLADGSLKTLLKPYKEAERLSVHHNDLNIRTYPEAIVKGYIQTLRFQRRLRRPISSVTRF